jgi:plasmid stability protein
MEVSMAQIVVRGIDEEVMQKFKVRAKRQGKSAEQAVRELIEEAARETGRQDDWFERATAFREKLYRKYGQLDINAAELIREDRDSR